MQVTCIILAFSSLVVPSVRAARELSQQDAKILYHPGHGPVHITRLHRYDHSGLDAFLEREAAWTQQTVEPMMGAELPNNDVDAPSFLQLSDAQVEALHIHQQAMIQEGNTETETGGTVHAASAHYRDKSETLSRPSPSELAMLQRYATGHTGLKNGRAVTGLSSLMSQYVGPIGVGTTVSPDGCSMPSQSATSLSEEGSRAESKGHVSETASAKEGVQACQVDDQTKIWVVFDTGSTNIWISSDLCKSGPCAETGRQRYNHTRSLTFSYPQKPSTLTVQFGTGKLVGPQAVDDLHIGPFTVFNQTFAMIEDESGSVFHDVPFEGILGLAFPSMSANHVKPFFDTVIEQKALENNEFSVYFNRDTPAANAVFWGGVDKRFFTGDIEYFPITDPYYWSMDLHAFKIGKECLLGPGCSTSQRPSLSSVFLQTQQETKQSKQNLLHTTNLERQQPKAIVDTGTTYFTAEGELFSKVMERIPARRCKDVTEESHPNLTYTLSNAKGEPRDFVFNSNMYLIRSGSGDDAYCSPAFMRINIPVQHGPGMVLGEVFLRNFYAVFDRGDGGDNHGRVGLASSVHSKDVVGYLRELTHAQPSFQQARATAISKSQSLLQTSGSSITAERTQDNAARRSFKQRVLVPSETAYASSEGLGVVSRRLRH